MNSFSFEHTGHKCTATRQLDAAGKPTTLWNIECPAWTAGMVYDAETRDLTGGPGFPESTMRAMAGQLWRMGLASV